MGKIYQKFNKIASENKKKTAVKWKQKNKWQQCNYGKFLRLVDNVAGGLKFLGIKTGDRVAILSENRWEWLASDLAINKINAISVPVHATSNQDTIDYILRDSESSFLFVSRDLFEKHKCFLMGLDILDNIIIFNREENNLPEDVLLFSDLFQTKNKDLVKDDSSEDEDLICSIIYTSGTTGDPKGVMLTNNNFLSNVLSVKERIDILATDTFLSFLPLSHVLERTAGNYVPIFSGSTIAYAESMKKLTDNIKEVRPTIMICVPKIFEKVYEKIFAGIKEKGTLFKKLFFWSLKSEKGTLRKKIADKVIFSKLKRKVFRDKLRFAVSGGASINENILRFFNNIGVNIVEGYGLTETSPIVACNSIEKSKIGSVGFVVEGVQVKIAEDKEILVKGPNVMKGYWNKEEETREVLSEDGWFRTGDLGFLDGDDFLTIIGRKKDIIVTSNGKNVSPEKLEGIINLSPVIDQSLVVGHRKEFLVALIVVSEEVIQERYNSLEKDLVKDIIEDEIKKINTKFEKHEQIKKFKIMEKPFTVEAGELTPTLKIRRKIIEQKYSDIISKLYS